MLRLFLVLRFFSHRRHLHATAGCLCRTLEYFSLVHGSVWLVVFLFLFFPSDSLLNVSWVLCTGHWLSSQAGSSSRLKGILYFPATWQLRFDQMWCVSFRWLLPSSPHSPPSWHSVFLQVEVVLLNVGDDWAAHPEWPHEKSHPQTGWLLDDNGLYKCLLKILA